MIHCQMCGIAVPTNGSMAYSSGLCEPCLDSVWKEMESEEEHGYWYTDAEGNKCWTEDFETSIGE